MIKFKSLLLAGVFALASLGPGLAAGMLTNGLPPAGGSQYPTTLPLTGNETLPADTNLPNGLNPASEAVTVNQIQASVYGEPGSGGFRNKLIGGDAGTNLWQRGTSVGSITSTYLYTADRFFDWNGTSSTVSVAQDTTAAELPLGYSMAFKVSRTGAGVIQNCFAQEVQSANAISTAGHTVELDFHAYAGAGFSAANGALQAYILTGTGTDEGAQKMAWGLNGGGGGSTGWTGMTNALNSAAIGGANPATSTVALTPSTLGRYIAVANIPATATEVGVALCWKPVGGSPSNDYLAFSGIQLAINDNLAQYAGTVQPTTNVPASNFERRPASVEAGLQLPYYYQITDNGATTAVVTLCQATTTAAVVCPIYFPVPMRIVPTAVASATTAFGDTVAAGTVTACTGFAVVASSTSTTTGKVTCTAGATVVAGNASQLVDENTTANVSFNSEL